MSERKFHQELVQAQKHFYPDAFFYKIPDAIPSKGGASRFIPQKPFDSILVVDGQAIAIEYKSFKGKSYQLELRPSQVKGLRKAKESGMAAIILIQCERREFAGLIRINDYGPHKYSDDDLFWKTYTVAKIKIGRATRWDFPKILSYA